MPVSDLTHQMALDRIAALVQALRDFGSHGNYCKAWKRTFVATSAADEDPDCSCGYSAAFKLKEEQ